MGINWLVLVGLQSHGLHPTWDHSPDPLLAACHVTGSLKAPRLPPRPEAFCSDLVAQRGREACVWLAPPPAWAGGAFVSARGQGELAGEGPVLFLTPAVVYSLWKGREGNSLTAALAPYLGPLTALQISLLASTFSRLCSQETYRGGDLGVGRCCWLRGACLAATQAGEICWGCCLSSTCLPAEANPAGLHSLLSTEAACKQANPFTRAACELLNQLNLSLKPACWLHPHAPQKSLLRRDG